MKLKISEIKKLTDRYPFLVPRNVWTDEIPDDYDYSYIRGQELPNGWFSLFIQMCEDIRQPLIDNNYIDRFRFTQIKEKYNRMTCYHNGAPQQVDDTINTYSVISGYICTKCGLPATHETQGYIASLCTDCWRGCAQHIKCKHIEFKPYYKRILYDSREKKEHTYTISFENEWDRYIKSINRTVN